MAKKYGWPKHRSKKGTYAAVVRHGLKHLKRAEKAAKDGSCRVALQNARIANRDFMDSVLTKPSAFIKDLEGWKAHMQRVDAV